MRVNQGKYRLGDRNIRQVLIGSFHGVLNVIRQILQLVDQVWKFWRIDLGKLQFPLWQMMEDFLRRSPV